jgi:hypothetical protein
MNPHTRFPVGAKNLSPLCPFRPFFHASGMNRPVENVKPKKISTSKRLHICHHASSLQVERLRHAVFSQEQQFRPYFFQAFKSEPIGRKRVHTKKISTSERLHICHPASSLQVAILTECVFYAGTMFSTELRKPTVCGDLPRFYVFFFFHAVRLE